MICRIDGCNHVIRRHSATPGGSWESLGTCPCCAREIKRLNPGRFDHVNVYYATRCREGKVHRHGRPLTALVYESMPAGDASVEDMVRALAVRATYRAVRNAAKGLAGRGLLERVPGRQGLYRKK